MALNALNHPDPETLAAFSLGKLSGALADRVAQHVEECTMCQDAVSQTPADTFLNQLRAARSALSADAIPTDAHPAQDTQSESAPASDGSSPVPKLPPELAKKYRIRKELGRGGMGVVYQAEHIQMERLVALKVISKSILDNPTATQRFAQEVKAAAQLNHPNIVAAYDFEQAGDLHMLVMEYVEGSNLAEVVERKGPLPVAHACHYVRQAAQGLQHAFERKMIHRDLKPHNLMLTPQGTVKVLDLGLARRTSNCPQQSGVTAVGTVVGTPEYIAPEQARDSSTADIRADIYSLGCTLFCLLTGKPPFPDGAPMQKLLAHIEQEAPSLRQLRPDVSAELAAVVMKMMAKKPEDRYQTPAEVMAALAPFCESGQRTPTAKTGQPRLAVARKPWAPVAVALVVALATGLMAQIVIRIKRADGKETELTAPAGSQVAIDGKGDVTVTLPAERVASSNEPAKPKPQTNAEPAPLQILKGHENPIVRLLFTPDGARVISASNGDHPVRDGNRRVYWAGGDNSVRVWNVESGEQVRRFNTREGHRYGAQGLCLSPDGNLIAAATSWSWGQSDSRVYIWDLRTGERKHHFAISGSQTLRGVGFSPDGSRVLAVVGSEKTVHSWSLSDGKESPVLSLEEPVPGTFSRMTIPPACRWLLGGVGGPYRGGGFDDSNGTFRLWDLTTGKIVHTFTGHRKTPTEVIMSADESRILSCAGDFAVRLWDPGSGREVLCLDNLDSNVLSVAFCPDGKRFLTGAADGMVLLRETKSGKVLAGFRGHTGKVHSVSVSHTGRLAASGGEDKVVRLWELPTAKPE
jgi:WD40 repeat protein/tRNA A-37 threonylcarbamoyl transferase component Bud32